MRAERVVLSELHRDLCRQLRRQPLGRVDRRQLFQLVVRLVRELPGFLSDVAVLGVALRRDRHVFTERHRDRAGRQAGKPGREDCVARCVGGPSQTVGTSVP